MRGKDKNIEQMEKYRKRFFHYAESDLETAKILYNAGSADFMTEITSASKYYGAAKALEKTIKFQIQEGEKTKMRMRTDRDLQLILGGFLQRIIGIIILFASVVIFKSLDGDITGLILTVPMGLYMLFTRRNVINI